jgi:hypothetical protein
MKDFFTAYHKANIRKYTSSGVIALALSLSIVWLVNQGPQSMILANVLQAGSDEIVDYSADMIVERSGDTLSLRLGKDAYDVDLITLTLLGDPERLVSLASTDPSVTIMENEPGVSLVKITKNKAQYKAGEVITTLTATVSWETVITPVDPVLTSGTQSYTLSIQGGE